MTATTALTNIAPAHLIPQPRKIVYLEGQVSLAQGIRLTNAELFPAAGTVLLERLARSSGLRVSSNPDAATAHFAVDTSLEKEAYKLLVEQNSISIIASSPAGANWAIQTLLQLLPPQALGYEPFDPAQMLIPAVQIYDAPKYAWRGSHIDVARHFLPLAGLLRHLEVMALHKLNVLHLHLTDDQGWRLPVAEYPLLTKVGAWRPGTLSGHQPPADARGSDDVALHDGIPHGGFYSRADIALLVDKAHTYGITIVPEIDMPGHMEAAIAAYPELGCTPVPHPRTCWGVSWHVLSLTPKNLDFCRAVLDTAMDLFPNSPIHVGGDECPGQELLRDPGTRETMARIGATTRAQAQTWFESQVCAHVLNAGRQVIAWDEVLQPQLDPAVDIMIWRDWQQAQTALKHGHRIVAAPGALTYFDHDQVLSPRRPISIGEELSLQTSAGLAAYLDQCRELGTAQVRGGQFQLWTEYVRTWARAENLLWPRGACMAQQLWTGRSAGSASYTDLGIHLDRLSACEVNWCHLDELI